METNYSENVYKPRLAAGLEYQDFLCTALHKRGIVLQNLQSKKYQLKKENLLGLEIKFDRKFEETGNVYIEIEEKSDPANACYVPSGIYRDDENWLYAVGNYAEVFIFAKTLLREAHAAERFLREVENETKTSRGFLLTRATAERWAALHLRFERKERQ